MSPDDDDNDMGDGYLKSNKSGIKIIFSLKELQKVEQFYHSIPAFQKDKITDIHLRLDNKNMA